MIYGLREDFRRHHPAKPPSFLAVAWTLASSPGFLATAIYRYASRSAQRGIPGLPKILRSLSIALTGADISPGAVIGAGLLIHHPVGIVVGANARIGLSCTLLQNVTVGERISEDGNSKNPLIGSRVVVGAGACILGDVTIGDDVTVGANAVVTDSVPPNAVAYGVPARWRSKAGSPVPVDMPNRDQVGE